MDEQARLTKKAKEAERLQGVPPETTLQMGFSLTRLARRLGEAADRARA